MAIESKATEPVLMTVAEVSKRLRVSPACVYALVAEGRLTCYRIGVGRGTLRFDEEQVSQFLQDSLSQGQSPEGLKHIQLPASPRRPGAAASATSDRSAPAAS